MLFFELLLISHVYMDNEIIIKDKNGDNYMVHKSSTLHFLTNYPIFYPTQDDCLDAVKGFMNISRSDQEEEQFYYCIGKYFYLSTKTIDDHLDENGKFNNKCKASI